MQQFIRTPHRDGERPSRTDPPGKAHQLAMRPGVAAGLGLLMVLACAMIPLRASAGNLSFLGNTPLNFLEPDDVALMKKNAIELLDSGKLNTKQSWSNPKTGATGFAQVTGQFTMADGTPCKRLRLFNKAGGMENVSTYPVCKYSGRGWRINADAQAAK
jgi:hypothetical protein